MPVNNIPQAVIEGYTTESNCIAKRGSNASFNTKQVGGLDYRKRAQRLCDQLEGSELATPAMMGCIEDPTNVSDTYSWKGNYEMVCRRLADTWGAWYPEMFGCPKVDPTAKFGTR